MSVGDALMTRQGDCSAAATVYPTGLVQPGGALVDEIDLRGMNLNRGLACVVHVPEVSNAGATLTATFEVDTDPGFATALRTALGPLVIETTGKHLLGYLFGIPESYGRFKLVVGGTTPDFGDVLCMVTLESDTRRLGVV